MKVKALPVGWPWVSVSQRRLGLLSMCKANKLTLEVFEHCCRVLVYHSFMKKSYADQPLGDLTRENK